MGKKIRTKFPMARIKKIMQSDEDVGKVAQATPVLISKTLELFLLKLVEQTVARTQAKGARVVSVAHLKQCIMEEASFDFLKDTVQKVPDAGPEEPAAPKRASSKKKQLSSSTASLMSSREEGSDEEEDEEEDEDDDDEEERKPKRQAKKPRKAPTPKVKSVTIAPEAIAKAPTVQPKDEVMSDDRPAAVPAVVTAVVPLASGGLVSAPMASKMAMDDDYD